MEKFILKKKPKIIVVLGQTSTGKSDLAVEIAKCFNGEVISADSRQVYRGMDLGSGKITKEEMQGVPHHLLDVADPREVFDVQVFQKLGTKAIKDILARGKVPIICGGTGFYIDALVHQTEFSSAGRNEKLREKLREMSLEELQELYRKKTSQFHTKNIVSRIRYILKCLFSKQKNCFAPFHFIRNNKIDLQNPVRIIRALEIIEELGYIPKAKQKNPYDVLFIGLMLPRDTLNKKIYERIIKRLERGMLDEARKLLANGVSHERLQSLGLEYRFMSKYLLGEITREEMIEQLYRATVQFAKRQRTWFKRNKKIEWYHPLKEREKIFQRVEKFLN